MRIHCPYCGPRGHEEFAYLGDAAPRRPDPAAPGATAAFVEYVYARENPAGAIEELWFHAHGCHAWLLVERDTRTHAIAAVRPARPAADRGRA